MTETSDTKIGSGACASRVASLMERLNMAAADWVAQSPDARGVVLRNIRTMAAANPTLASAFNLLRA